MKNKNIKFLALCALVIISSAYVFANEPTDPPKKKEVEKIDIKVNDKPHEVYVNKTMIEKVKNSKADFNQEANANRWYSYLYGKQVENTTMASINKNSAKEKPQK